MTRTRLNATLICLLIAFSAIALAGSEESGRPEGGYDLSWFTIDGGGATFSAGGGFELGGTIGQSDATSPMTGGGFSLTGGFWAGVGGLPIDVCLPDITGDLLVNVDDLLAIINGWGPCPAPPTACGADIAPAPNGDLTVNVDDLLAVINAWGLCP